MSNAVKVTFQPEGRTVFAMPGTLLIEAAGKAGIAFNSPCGGKGTCGKCRVRIMQGAPPPNPACERMLSAEEIREGHRLACQTHVERDMVVSVPQESRFFAQKILTAGEGQAVALRPNVRKTFVQLEEPSLADQSADTDRLLGALGDGVEAGIEVIRDIPDVLRRSRFAVTAVMTDSVLCALEEGDTSAENYGVAFDIGTTTVVGMLHDLNSGRSLAVASRTNPQIPFGDDVVSRINYVQENEHGQETLRTEITGCLNEIIAEVGEQAGVEPARIYEATVVGNTTMGHLFLGVQPTYLGQAPYVAGLGRGIDVPAAALGLRIHPRGSVHVLPNIAGFVGADTVGVVLACDMLNSEAMSLAIDIGTNGEIVMGSRDRLVSCSTAAGPAFEGARIKFGMRAAAGAIDKMRITDDLRLSVIGDVPPRGLCGTALVDLVAELLRVGVIDSTGRMLPADDLPQTVPDAIRRRLVPGDKSGCDFVIAEEDGHPCVWLTQRDVRELQLAKAAIAAGIQILMGELGVEPDQIAHVFLAGAFGNFIRRSMARRIGLLPDLPSDRIRFVGNAAGAGARMSLLSRDCRAEAARIAARTEYLELAGRPEFQHEFTTAMFFPDP